ncbi:Maf-like protein-domain-containing protein [Sphaerosporella brunnea]|uniref:Maf-like protein-domain-containing protein n=1 Tax=Sphaerosporella brunnea TaxID=1250544 RepID=A0A5J5EVC9_9PEZI|nr:Maf-like protein-domain-containing protein [Sphaerosporella brunnea]
MASWLYNTVFGTGPKNVSVVSSGSSSSTSLLPSEPPPSYEASSSEKKKEQPPRQPLRREPLSLPALTLLRSKRVILASASPRRKQLLQNLHLPNLEIVPSSFAEDLDKSHFTPWEYVLETATQKCQTVYATEIAREDVEEPVLVLAADTVICLTSGEVLEKPSSESHHLAMLQALRDAGTHKVYTAIVAMTPLETAVHPGYAMEHHVEETLVTFDKSVTDDLLLSYVKTREGADKAGGYAIQGLGAILVEKIEGSYDNVVGLPMRATLRLIEKVLSGDDDTNEEGEEEEQVKI